MPSYVGLGVITVTGQIADGVITGAKLANNLELPAVVRYQRIENSSTAGTPPAAGTGGFYQTDISSVSIKMGTAAFINFQNPPASATLRRLNATGVFDLGLLVDSEIAAGAAIAKSKIATAATWALADLPALTQRGSTQNTGRTISTTSTSFVNLATLTITPTSATNVCIVHGGVNGINNNTGGNSTFIRVAFGVNNGPANGINQVTATAGQASPADVVGIFKDQAAALTTVAFQWRVDATTGSTAFTGTANESDYVEVGIVQN